MRNSITHPLKVNWIPIEGDIGRIGLTLCPGKYQPVSRTGGWNRQLSIDVATLVELKTNRVVSLITDEDMGLLRVTELPQVITEHSMAWEHLPLEDTTVPTRAWLKAAKPVFRSLLTSIPEGETVVVHCMGGLSRAGTFVSIYLWLRGSSMTDAIERVRTERDSRAINLEQEAFLQRLEKTGYIPRSKSIYMAQDSLLFANKLSSMIINENPYAEISEELEGAIVSNQSLDWKVIGDHILSIIQSGEQQFFTHYNLLDFAMQVYEAGGEDSILKRFQCQFELANIYSDQAGLGRKFELYENLVEGATSRMENNSTEDQFYYWLTRPLNRLAQLTQYWKGEEAAEPLWHQLFKVFTEAKEEEGLNIIEHNAPWFVTAHPELFPHHSD